jgi:hypothetical protein
MSALKERFDTMQAVLPAKSFGRGVMLIILTVLSPIGLTTLYTGSAEPPGAAPDVCAAAEPLKTASANESSRRIEACRYDLNILKCLTLCS